jgi:methanogenic corrinoid protein MtbC1
MTEAGPLSAKRFRQKGTGVLPVLKGCLADPKGRDAGDRSALKRAIERQVVPRLLLANQCASQGAALSMPVAETPSDDVAELSNIVLGHDDDAALAFIESRRARGASLESLYLDVLATTARRLGDLWDTDALDFTAVTLGLCRLHRVLREFDPAFVSEAEVEPNGLPALLVPVPGEQHAFGLLMVSEFFRRAGWNVWNGPLMSRAELAALVHDQWFAVIGFSLSCERRLDALASAIHSARRESRNRSISVLVGGHVFIEHPELVAHVGADAMAVDARQAPLQAQALVAAAAQWN